MFTNHLLFFLLRTREKLIGRCLFTNIRLESNEISCSCFVVISLRFKKLLIDENSRCLYQGLSIHSHWFHRKMNVNYTFVNNLYDYRRWNELMLVGSLIEYVFISSSRDLRWLYGVMPIALTIHFTAHAILFFLFSCYVYEYIYLNKCGLRVPELADTKHDIWRCVERINLFADGQNYGIESRWTSKAVL